MSEFVVDASVAVKWLMIEPHDAVAGRLLHAGHDLLVPDLVFVEVANALWKRVMRRETTVASATQALQTLDSLPLQIHPSQPLLPLAFELAARFGRTVYDSLYLAVALLRHCPVVTADGVLYRALEQTVLRSHVLWVADVP